MCSILYEMELLLILIFKEEQGLFVLRKISIVLLN